VDAAVVSDLPPAAGLSSSSALIVAFTLALLQANRRQASFEELMEILPEGEQFVGTRGGGMDHAASLASRAGWCLADRIRPAVGAPDSRAAGLALSGGPQSPDGREIRRRARRIQCPPRGGECRSKANWVRSYRARLRSRHPRERLPPRPGAR